MGHFLGILRLKAAFGLVLALGAFGCAGTLGSEAPSFDPTGIYDVTMATQGMVSEGTMTIRGIPGDYRGTLAAGGVSADIKSVAVGEGNMSVSAETGGGVLILRILKDGPMFSGNWVLGERRGTFAAEKREDP